MFKKNTAVTGFGIGHFINTSTGAAVTTGTPTCKRTLDGTGGACANAAAYNTDGAVWEIDLAAGDMNADCVILSFTLTDCLPISYTIKTVTGVPDANGYFPADAVAISGDTVAADNLEAACDGNTYNVGGGAVVAASVTGAVGSVTGAVGSVTAGVTLANGAHGGAAATITLQTPIAATVPDTQKVDVNTIKTQAVTCAAGVTVGAYVGSTGAAALASVCTETRLAELDAANLPADLTAIKGATFDTATDSLEAIRNRGDAAWTTATGFSTLDAAGVRTAVGLASANLDTQLAALPTAAEVVTALGTGSTLSAVPWNAAWDAEVQSECTDALTAAALTAAGIADQVWDEAISGHAVAGSTGATLSALVSGSAVNLATETNIFQSK